MKFTKPIIIVDDSNHNLYYDLIFDNDISVPLTVDSEINFVIFDTQLGIVINPTSYSQFIETNNFNKKYSDYNGINSELAITLYKKIYDYESDTRTEILIDQDILNSFNIACQCNSITYNNTTFEYKINIKLVTGLILNQYSEKTNFNSNTVYSINIDFNKFFGFTNNNSNNIITVDFITENPTDIITNYSEYCNNPLFILNELQNIMNIQYMISNGDRYNYQFTPIKYTDEGITKQELDISGNPLKIKNNIQTQIEDCFISEFLQEYKNYFNVLNNEKLDDIFLKNVKLSMFPKSRYVNTSVKGTQKGIENIINMFCKQIGNYSAIVEPSHTQNNFIYRITTNLPKHYWTDIIKPIVHPLSWKDEYIDITNDNNKEYPNTNIKISNYKNKIKEYIDQITEYPITYLYINSNQPYNKSTRYYDIAVINNFGSEYIFSFKPSNYSVNLDYDNQTLVDYLIDVNNIIANVSVNPNNPLTDLLTVEFIKPGIALEYEFYISINSEIFASINSYFPIFKAELPQLNVGDTMEITLILKNSMFSDSPIGTITRTTNSYPKWFNILSPTYIIPKDGQGNVNQTYWGTNNSIKFS